ncbi:MAG: tetratricopeptide repeat protein [Coleofasciculus sp. A1-SPW-01]|uniref:tetratricopeptide repeat protein n=1 Tax=Coleofasciculus sp. A1-SPW-01 TaxID=3070819 RepID=UPI0032F354C1
MTDLNQVLEINPNYAQAYYHRGLTHVQLGNEEEAIADFQKAADLSRQQGDMTIYQNALDQIQQIQP